MQQGFYHVISLNNPCPLHLFDENASFVSRNFHFGALSAVPGNVNYFVLDSSPSLSGSEMRAGFFTLNHSLPFITAVVVSLIIDGDNQPLFYRSMRALNKH